MFEINRFRKKMGVDIHSWIKNYNVKLIVFNIIMVFLFLLRSAGYFQPYFPISVNFIVIFGLILSVFLLGAGSRAIFIFALLAWIFAGLLNIFHIYVWTDRTGIYVYEAFVIGVVVYLREAIFK